MLKFRLVEGQYIATLEGQCIRNKKMLMPILKINGYLLHLFKDNTARNTLILKFSFT